MVANRDVNFMATSSCLDAAGFVLAGGQSTRMGRDKALLEFAGRPLIAHALSILRQAGLPVSIAGAHADLASYAPVVADAAQGLGPLSGICAALQSTAAQHAVFLPVDQPLTPPSLITCLLHHARITGCAVTMASLCGVAQTFPAIVDRAALPLLKADLAAGRRGCKAAFRAASGEGAGTVVAVELLAQAGQVVDSRQLPPSWWFLNANTPAEMERILHIEAGIT
jgi:molybdenum cofactor guanylyltransferase